jgi:hypothetical protein
VGHGCVPPTQDAAISQVTRHRGCRISRFPAFQRVVDGCVPLKTIQERLGHALTGSFTLDVYGGKPEWARNLEAALRVGAEIERAVTAQEQESKAAGIDYSGGLTAIRENGSGAAIS